MDLVDRRILITGGTSGIGLALAHRLSERNRVVVAGRDEVRLSGLAESGLADASLDVTSEPQARAVVEDVVRRLGGLDVLVNSAGVLLPRPLELDDGGDGADDGAAAQTEVDVNLLGSMRMTRLALPHLRASNGIVVFISSALALTAAPGLSTYAATKAAVHSYARSLRAEQARNVTVVDVLPPFVDTALSAAIDAPKVTADAVAEAIVEGLERGRVEIRVGRVAALARLARIWPPAADRIVAKQLRRI
jgi:uncharacterized oxidoreductase